MRWLLLSVLFVGCAHKPAAAPAPPTIVRNDARFALCDITLDGVDGRPLAPGEARTVPSRGGAAPPAVRARPCDGGHERCLAARKQDPSQSEVFLFAEESCERPQREILLPIEVVNLIDEPLCAVELLTGEHERDRILLLDRRHRTARLDENRTAIMTFEADEAPRIHGVRASTCKDTRTACSFPLKMTKFPPPPLTFDDTVCPRVMREPLVTVLVQNKSPTALCKLELTAKGGFSSGNLLAKSMPAGSELPVAASPGPWSFRASPCESNAFITGTADSGTLVVAAKP